MCLERVASEVGKGIFAGLGGTAVMTLSSTVEMKLRGRSASNTPAEAICQLLGIEAMNEDEKTRLTNLVHWGYGTSWGAVRGLIALAGLDGPSAGAAFFAAVWGGEVISLPALGVAPPLTQWGPEGIGIDAIHHLAYALGTSFAYEVIDRT